MLTKEDLRESLAVQEWLEEGRTEGRTEGHRETAEEWLRAALERFPGISLPADLPPAVDLSVVAKEVMFAPDEASARLVLAAHGLAG